MVGDPITGRDSALLSYLTFLYSSITIIGSESRRAQTAISLDPYPGKPKVTFKEDGTFKITVFSDLHYGENPWDAWGPQQDVNSTRLMRIVLASEKPDYVYASPKFLHFSFIFSYWWFNGPIAVY